MRYRPRDGLPPDAVVWEGRVPNGALVVALDDETVRAILEETMRLGPRNRPDVLALSRVHSVGARRLRQALKRTVAHRGTQLVPQEQAFDTLPTARQRHRGRIARRGVDSGEKLGRHRWVVERTHAWLARYRRLSVRYERHADIHEALLYLGCSLICLDYLPGGFAMQSKFGPRSSGGGPGLSPLFMRSRYRPHARSARPMGRFTGS